VDFCLQNLVKNRKARVSKVSPEAMAALTRHNWPGNVRELENVIYRSAVIAQGDAILVKDLPAEIRGTFPTESESAPALTSATGLVAPSHVEPQKAQEEIATETSTNDAATVQTASAVAVPTAAEVALEPPLTLERALDFVFHTIKETGKPLLPQIELELIARAMKLEGDDIAKSAKLLGMTKAGLQKRLNGS
jgi:two-component system nitrogen regulation response regulator GlnG